MSARGCTGTEREGDIEEEENAEHEEALLTRKHERKIDPFIDQEMVFVKILNGSNGGRR